MKPQIKDFSKHLFWDTNRGLLDVKENDAYIIKQVLEYGKMRDWRIIRDFYGIQWIAKNAMTYRSLDKKALSFISLLSGISKKEFRCYTYQQSIPRHWDF